ncbi:MAG: hypothetical protein ACYDBB_09825 [Armatimonadota bacterium]
MADQITLAVGDYVRLKSYTANENKSAEVTNNRSISAYAPIDGLVLSIREVRSGRMVDKAKGEPSDFVVEVVVDASFSTRYASLRNAPRGSDRPALTPTWRQLSVHLRALAEKGQLFSTATPEQLAGSPLGKVLDGWKVLKVWSHELESMEQPEAEEQTAAG